MRRGDFAPVAADVGVAHVIGEDEDDVRRSRLGGNRGERGGEAKKEAEKMQGREEESAAGAAGWKADTSTAAAAPQPPSIVTFQSGIIIRHHASALRPEWH